MTNALQGRRLHRISRSLKTLSQFICGFALSALSLKTHATEDASAHLPLVDEDGIVPESVLEAFLSPAEFSARRFVHKSTQEESFFAMDAGLSASPPIIELHPERIPWPETAGLELLIEGKPLPLTPKPGLTDEVLDRGFQIRWTIEALGQRFSPAVHFAARVVAAEVLSADTDRILATWYAPRKPPFCRFDAPRDKPKCRVNIGFETRAVSISPDGARLSLAFGGLRPRIEVYDIRRAPKLLWQAIFNQGSGGILETAFSSDGEWVTALTAKGAMHRFDAKSGGMHLQVPSSGRTALAVPPGRVIAVAGDNGEVTLWYLADGTVARKFPPRSNRGPVARLAASGNGEVIATLEYTASKSIIRAWSVKNRALLRQFELDGRTVAAIALDEDGKNLFVSREPDGLLSAPLSSRAPLEQIEGKSAGRCQGRIEWISAQATLICSVKNGLLRINARGAVKDMLKVDDLATDWVSAASPGGSKIAAAGGGHLLIWWTD